MSFGPAALADRLQELKGDAGEPARFVVALSGGLDSTALTKALSVLCREDPRFASVPALAIHVNHGLRPESVDWSEHCREFAASLPIEYRSLNVTVDTGSGKGPEASARDARYAALQAELERDDWLLTAHHGQDQAETLLLNLIRGSGPTGIAGIPGARRFASGWLLRPLLGVDRADVLHYATLSGLSWIDDASNADRRFDRNFLRHEILPRLESRWPDIATRLGRSASHAGEASKLLLDLAEIDFKALGGSQSRLPIGALSMLLPARQRNVIRYALRESGLTIPGRAQLERIRNEVMPARDDAQPRVRWPGGCVRRYRDGLYLLPEHLADVVESSVVTNAESVLGKGLGVLRFENIAGVGIEPSLLGAGLRLEPRKGGEKIRLPGQRHTRKLKKLLQESGVVPWMRDRLPLLYSGDRLIAVGDLWLAADAVAEPGVAVRWIGRPALH